MTPAFPDGTTWPYIPPPEKARPDLGGDADPGTYEADARYNNPETLRVAKVVHSADWGTPVEECHAGTDDYRIAAAVLADLRERYILVPRDGAEEHRVHQIADTDGGAWHAVAMDANLDPRVPFLHRYRTYILGPWEDTP